MANMIWTGGRKRTGKCRFTCLSIVDFVSDGLMKSHLLVVFDLIECRHYDISLPHLVFSLNLNFPLCNAFSAFETFVVKMT